MINIQNFFKSLINKPYIYEILQLKKEKENENEILKLELNFYKNK